MYWNSVLVFCLPKGCVVVVVVVVSLSKLGDFVSLPIFTKRFYCNPNYKNWVLTCITFVKPTWSVRHTFCISSTFYKIWFLSTFWLNRISYSSQSSLGQNWKLSIAFKNYGKYLCVEERTMINILRQMSLI